MKIIDFFKNLEYKKLLVKYIELEDEELFQKSVNDLETNECIISVLGVQGSGKSSFLNALLFGDVVLPVDAKETTCIPTVIRHGGGDVPVAHVIFNDGRRQAVECSEDGIGKYVHQDNNPDNRLGVSCVEIEYNEELLANGLTLVDLPGVGSITAANQATTMNYLKKSTGALFMLRTCPTITKNEATFIQGALPLMGHMFWMQNQWTDEAANDVKSAKEENFSILQRIAEEMHQPKEIISEPLIVCVKHALDGRILGKDELVNGSGINQIRQSLVDFREKWREEIKSGKTAQARKMLESAIAAATDRIRLLDGDAEEELARLREAKKSAEKSLEDNREIVREAIASLADSSRALAETIESNCTIFSENLRNDVREVISSGVVGGSNLNKAFQDHLHERYEELFQTVQPEFLKVVEELAKSLSGLSETSIAAQNVSVQASFTEKSKMPDHYGRFGSVGGVLAGGAIGTAILPGVGTVIGAAIGGLLGWLTGSMARNIQVKSQQETARRELFGYVEEARKEASKTLRNSLSKFRKDVEENINDWLRQQEASIDADYGKARAEITQPLEKKRADKAEAEKDLQRLEGIMKEIED